MEFYFIFRFKIKIIYVPMHLIHNCFYLIQYILMYHPQHIHISNESYEILKAVLNSILVL